MMNPKTKYMNRFSGNLHSWVFSLLFATIMTFVPVVLSGQQIVSLNDAVELGLVNNYLIKVAKNQTDMSLHNISYGNAGFMPLLTTFGFLEKAHLDAHQDVVNGSRLDNKNADATVMSAGIKAEWVLFDGTGMFARYDKLKGLWKINDLETRITMEYVVQEIILAYCNIIRQLELLKACNQRLRSSNFRYFIAREKLDSKLGSEQEWLQTDVARMADSSAVFKQTSELRKSKIQLNRLLALNVQRDFITEDSITLVQIPNLDQLTTNSIDFNNLLKIKTEELMYSKLEEKSLKSEQYPRLLLFGSYGYYENKTEAAFINYNQYFGPQVGLAVGMRLFDGTKLRTSLQNAKINIQNKELQLKDMQEQVSAQIAEMHLDYLCQMQTIMLGKKELALAEKNLDIAMKAFQSGQISSLDLRVAQDGLFQASSNLVNAYYYAKLKETELLSVSGMLIK
jgi:outer membrane protein